MISLKSGDTAPNFTANNQNSEKISLADFKGKTLVLYFYPKDNTPGCTAEACDLRDNFEALKKSGFEILGVSPDSEVSHQKFIKKHNLPFDLLADTEKEIIKSYGVWGEKKMFGKIKEGVFRTTFIINKDGIISEVIDKVKTKYHAAQIYPDILLMEE
ncbi:MAG: thioredoxin-dependent thiol peroxidase [Bacteroidetes bacterium]|jgi:thioredoxin-dependent peroxiredoxin|nr:thioredoxin-dependent thiol peroxidase [Bacteroidota bacterium]MBT6686936.1 thioredoxin-dependent thiol peroxidase [Bacteroidota bacterium]MBT7143210.1 thioredoxin-dependent thiol peroxidase [Bacteroidota bacterium]MBT7492812.1 thioredoxin-dependent thiol peroxidase [Bacteroidota bacterium]